jgi:hypothetical protein
MESTDERLSEYDNKRCSSATCKVVAHNAVQLRSEHIIHRFGIPKTLTCYRSSHITYAKEIKEFIDLFKIKMLNSSPYYVQANGQAVSNSKILTKFMRRRLKISKNMT